MFVMLAAAGLGARNARVRSNCGTTCKEFLFCYFERGPTTYKVFIYLEDVCRELLNHLNLQLMPKMLRAAWKDTNGQEDGIMETIGIIVPGSVCHREMFVLYRFMNFCAPKVPRRSATNIWSGHILWSLPRFVVQRFISRSGGHLVRERSHPSLARAFRGFISPARALPNAACRTGYAWAGLIEESSWLTRRAVIALGFNKEVSSSL